MAKSKALKIRSKLDLLAQQVKDGMGDLTNVTPGQIKAWLKQEKRRGVDYGTARNIQRRVRVKPKSKDVVAVLPGINEAGLGTITNEAGLGTITNEAETSGRMRHSANHGQ
jgi:hypothetical protein